MLSLMCGDGDYGPGGPGASPPIIRGIVAHIPCSEGPEAVQMFADRMTLEESCSDGTLPAGLKGGREVLNGAAPDAGLVPAFVDAVQKVGELGLHWEICVSPAGFLNTPALVKQCPGTTFVVDHMGYCGKDFDSWLATVRELSAFGNVFMKLGAVEEWEVQPLTGYPPTCGADDDAPVLRYLVAALTEFGCHRCLFESNWFVCTGMKAAAAAAESAGSVPEG
jgi:predicted TIM-barrel fold metal-dependent hydrolase